MKIRPPCNGKVQCQKCGRMIRPGWMTAHPIIFMHKGAPVGPTCRRRLMEAGIDEDNFVKVSNG